MPLDVPPSSGPVSPERRAEVVESRGLYAHIDGRRALLQLAYTALLAAVWLTLYAAAGSIPHHLRADVDTITLPRLETRLFGHYMGSTLPRHALLDVAAAAIYALHFAVPFLFVSVAVAAHARAPCPGARPLSFLAALVVTSLAMNATQLAWPTTPPWYTESAGHAPASYARHGDPGGLARLDAAMNSTFFANLYRTNPIVFGSFPSGHAAWPVLVLMHQWTWRGRAVSLVHVAWIAWAAVYLHHHYVVDLVGAYVYSVAGIWLARVLWLVVGRFVGGADGLMGLLDAPLPSSEARAHAERAGDARFIQAVYAVVLGRGQTLFSAPDVWRAGVGDAQVRALWTPDLGDGAGAGRTPPDVERHAHA